MFYGITRKLFKKKVDRAGKEITHQLGFVYEYISNTLSGIREAIYYDRTKFLKKQVRNNFNNNLYRDVNDIFGKNNSQRQFMLNPIQTIPNNQNDFARWCYGRPPTCKEGNGNQCIANQFNLPHGIARNKQFGKL